MAKWFYSNMAMVKVNNHAHAQIHTAYKEAALDCFIEVISSNACYRAMMCTYDSQMIIWLGDILMIPK